MKTRNALAIVVAALSFQAFAQGPELTAEQIIEKNIEATGGRAAYEAIKSQIVTGEIDLGAMGIKGTMKTYVKGNKILVVTDIPNIATTKQGFDGTIAWQEDPITGLRKLTGPERESLVRSASSSTVNWKDFFKSVSLEGKEKVGDREAYVVVMTPKVGEPVKTFYDAETFLALRTVTTVKTPMMTMDTEMTFSDYKDAGGIKMPYKMVMKSGPTEATITVTKVETNVPIDDKLFAYPGEAKPAPAKPALKKDAKKDVKKGTKSSGTKRK